MELRGKLNAKQNVVGVVAVLVIIAALIYISKQVTSRPATMQSHRFAWYYDTTTGKYFTEIAGLRTPITSPDGNVAIRAHFYTCGGCSQSERFLGFYDNYSTGITPALKAVIEGKSSASSPEINTDNSRYSFDGKTWFSLADSKFQAALQKKLRCSDGSLAKECLPK